MLTAQDIIGRIQAAETAEEFEALKERYGDDARKGVQRAFERKMRSLARAQQEEARLDSLYQTMYDLAHIKPSASTYKNLIIGIDEVGRGPLAGPLTVGAVALPPNVHIAGLNDSKQITPAQRELIAQEIHQKAWAVGIASLEPAEIDERGMAQALREAMKRALELALQDARARQQVQGHTEVLQDANASHASTDEVGLGALLIDGNPVHIHPKERCVVKGDAQVACIAAASIVAKVARDAYMVEMSELYPAYDFAHNKGYGSQKHIDAIKRLGLTPLHRVSFCGNFTETMSIFDL